MYHIIVNKKSRSGRGEKLWPVIEGELERRRTEFRVYPTKYHGSARETAARLTAKGVWNPDDVLLVIGGDGTANEAVDGITSLSDVKFGYIPTGSGNDFARGAGIPSDPLQALDADREFLTAGGVFTDEAIDAYIALRIEENDRVRMTPHPVEFELYYSV